tara:strand:- start:17 stop:553 length:537 start_codon:yes stop_codon:yes gene_type:complete
MEMETYTPIKDYEQTYEVSNMGNINKIMKSGKRKPVKKHKQPSGQLFVYLSKKGVKNSFSLCKLVFKTHAPQKLFEGGKDYDIVLDDDDKNNCALSNLTWFEKRKKGVCDYNDMTDCEKFAFDTKYMSYLEDHWGYDYYVFKRIVDYKLYREMWNIHTIDENLDYLKFRFEEFMKQFD